MEKNDKHLNVNPALQYRNYGKSLKRVLIPALQYRNLENAEKSDRQYRTFEASELRSNDSIANLSFCTEQDPHVWDAGDLRGSAETPSEVKRNRWFLQRPEAICHAPVGTRASRAVQ